MEATATGNTPLLAKIAAISAERQLIARWDQTCKDIFDGQSYSGMNSFHLAAWSGQVVCFEFFLNENLLSDLEVLDDDLQTPLHYAARFDELPIIRFLKERGCNLNPVARDGTTPLHLAVKSNHLPVVDELLNMGAEVKVCSRGLTPLAYAYNGGNLNMIGRLRDREDHSSLSTTFTSSRGFEIMADVFCAAMARNNFKTCENLRSQGLPIDYELTSPWSVTPLMYAICNASISHCSRGCRGQSRLQ